MITRRELLTSLPLLPSAVVSLEQKRLPPYSERAEQVSEYIQKAFWDGKAKRYHPAIPPTPQALPFDFMWANGIQFAALVGGTRHNPQKYRPLLDEFFNGLEAYFDTSALLPAYDAYLSSPGNSDKYYDDNAWMVLTLVEAFEVTGNRKFLNRAALLQRFIYSGWDEKCGGGIYWRQDHQNKNTCSNGPTAAAAIALARHLSPTFHIEWARRIVAWTNKTLQSPEGTFWDNISVATEKVERTKWTYNTALMLRANLGLYRATKETSYLQEAQRLAKASLSEFIHHETGAFRDDANFSHLLIEAFLDLYSETHEPNLLQCARQNADFVFTHVRDNRDGGYFTEWKLQPRHTEQKTLMGNAPIARLFWLMAPYDAKE